jgi:hypothetical protein
MIHKRSISSRHRFYRHLFLVAIAVVASMAVPFPLHRIGALGTVSLMILLSVELGGPIRAHQTQHRWPDSAYRGLGVLTLLCQLLWMSSPRDFAFIGFAVLLATTAFIFWSLKRLLICLAQETQIRMAVLGGAVAGYLLLGIIGGLLFGALETLAPGSFINQADGGRELLLAGLGADSASLRIWDLDFTRIHYFAFVSLTTVGYGDIIPVLPASQMASVALSISGPLYLAIVMGLLISRYTLQAEQQVKERSSAAPGRPQHSDADLDDR